MADSPLPPSHLAYRVGHVGEDPLANFDSIGLAIRRAIDDLLGAGWDWGNKRVLDFGCGSGRVLRQFMEEANGNTEFHGCDLDAESVLWLREHLSPPMTVFENGAEPPLEAPSGHFDLILAISVFTHIGAGWAEWLLEMRRLLRPGGLFIATFHGAGATDALQAAVGDSYDAERIGMLMLGGDDELGEAVFHSPWWLREHWGRAFDVVDIRESGFAVPDSPDLGHGSIVMRRPDGGDPSPGDLREPEPGEPRELVAAAYNTDVLYLRLQSLYARFNQYLSEAT